MSAVRTFSGADARSGAVARLAPALRAAAAAAGPEGRATLYSIDGVVKRATSGVEIIRFGTDDTAEGKLLRDAVVAADRDLGDGTIRLAAMFDAALRAGVQATGAGLHPSALMRAVEALTPEIDRAFEAETRPLDDPAALLRAADLPGAAQAALAEALECAGPEGQLELAEGQEPGLRVERVDGFTADLTPVLGGTLTEMGRVHLLVANEVIDDFAGLVPVIEGFARSDKSLVVVARGLEGAAKQLLERNRIAGVLKVSALVPRDAGPRAAEILADLAAATGATLIGGETGRDLGRMTPEMLGQAEGLRRSGDRVILTAPGGDAEAVAFRLRQIAAEIERHRYLALDREQAQRRYRRLSGRWVELRVGPDPTCPELQEKLARALASLDAARAGGWIAGAGLGLSRVAETLEAGLLDPQRAPARMAAEDRAARRLLCHALRAPMQALQRNAGFAEDHRAWADGLPPLADPASLSRLLLKTALSLALHILTFDVALRRV